jgi:serine/threonine-protein kinase SRPK3
MMNGDIKKAAINKAKQVANAANNATNSNGQKKRRKGTDLKPIITTESQQSAEASPSGATIPNHSG